MNVTGPIRAVITANATANALLSGRIFPVLIPKNTALPAVSIQVVSNLPSDTKSGVSTVDLVRIQVDSYANTYPDCAAVDEAVRGAIDKYAGVVNVTGSDVSASGVNYAIGGVRYETTQDIFEDNPEVYRLSSDYIVRLHR